MTSWNSLEMNELANLALICSDRHIFMCFPDPDKKIGYYNNLTN